MIVSFGTEHLEKTYQICFGHIERQFVNSKSLVKIAEFPERQFYKLNEKQHH